MDSEQLKQKELQKVFMDNYIQVSSKDSLLAWQEKVVLHLSDNVVDQKGTVFFKGYLLTGLNQVRLAMSNVLNVELMDEKGQVLKRQYHPINQGMISGNLELPKKLDNGKYYLRAYTRWMKNYGEEAYAVTPIIVGQDPESNSTSFNPGSGFTVTSESGKLISGMMNRIVMKLPFDDEPNAARTGYIVNNKGTIVGEITEYMNNLFTAAYVPEGGMTYQIKMSDGRFFSLPEAESEGFILQVNNLDAQKAFVRIGFTPKYTGSTVKLLGSMHGVTYREQYINIDESGELDLEISKTGIPRGVLQLSLIDSEGNLLAQRPIWIESNQLNIEVLPLESEQKDESLVQIKVTDLENNPVKTELALGINQLINHQDPIIRTTSDFDMSNLFMGDGSIAGNDLFDKARKDRFLKDINLLANAADIKQVRLSEMDDTDKILYPFQRGLELYGFAYDIENNILADTDIQVMAFSEGNIWAQDIKTDAKGQIFLNDIQLNGEAKLVFRTNSDNAEERLVKIIPAKNSSKNNSKALSKDILKKEKKRIYEATDLQMPDTTGLIVLDEIILKEKAMKKESNYALYNIEPNRVRYQDPERPRSIPELLLDIPGIIVRGLGTPYPSVISVRSASAGGGPILWVVDGFPLNQSLNQELLGNTRNNALVEVMNIVPAMDVERIEWVFGPEAAIFGTRSNGGVLLVYTRTAKDFEQKSMRKDAQLVFQGYESELDFEAYRNDKRRKAQQAMNSLYWNPSIQTDEEGKAVVRLPLPKIEGRIYVRASTITQDGRIGIYNAPLE